MQDAIFYIDPDSSLSLQNQIRQKLVDGILSGALAPGTRLPSSRKLASQLGIARNTVVLSYQELVAEGYLVSRQRSGIFVSEDILVGRVGYSGTAVATSEAEATRWRNRIKGQNSRTRMARDLPNWASYPYPFIDGKFDAALFPLAEWREASRLALGVSDAREWSAGSGGADDGKLIEQIRTKILPRRGIQARADEILVTMGTQNSLYLISELLADRTTTFAMEEPGNSSMRGLLQRRGVNLLAQPVDANGVVVDEHLAKADVLYVTPSHQIPTAVAMSPQRRSELLKSAHENDFLIIEDDYECETSYLDRPAPALRSMDQEGRVIYVASLTTLLAPATRLGFIVADAEFIREARELRRTVLNHPPLKLQRIAAYFLSLGHYDALMHRMARIFQERRTALRDALNYHRALSIEISPEVGGTTWWVRVPGEFDVDYLASEAERVGVLIETVGHYYANPDNAENCFRMGVTSIPIEKIQKGVETLTTMLRSRISERVEHLDDSRGDWLRGDELQSVMANTTILYSVVYGIPCTIELHADGTMTGHAGFANEDQDTGRWWVEGDRWFRKWEKWVYGNEAGYYVVVDGERIKWFNEDRQIVDSAFIRNDAG